MGRWGQQREGRATPQQGAHRDDELPWENWHDVYNEVIQPLANEGAEVYCQVIVIAQGDAAIRENTVELGIKESLGQRGIKADIQTG